MSQSNSHQEQTNRAFALSAAVMVMSASTPETCQLIIETTRFGSEDGVGFAQLERLSNVLLAYIETGTFPDDYRST